MLVLLWIAGKIDRLSEATAHIVRWALLANALLITVNAFSRTFLSMAWPDALDMQYHFFAAVVLLMAAYTFQRGEHVRIDIFAHRLGERGLAWLDLLGILLVLLPVCVGMAALIEMATGSGKTFAVQCLSSAQVRENQTHPVPGGLR